MLIDDGSASRDERRPIEPNWRVVALVGTAAMLGFGAAHAHGLIAYVIVCAIVYVLGRAIAELFDYGLGLREWRQ